MDFEQNDIVTKTIDLADDSILVPSEDADSVNKKSTHFEFGSNEKDSPLKLWL